ncbi:MAG: NUDIX domain-containing protein [Chloroflexi bacterium]|nr:NUDIX domain-containing protein [Chloroflexota bacterium]
MSQIACYDSNGNEILVSPENITFRPAVYGIFIEHQQVLLTRHLQTGLWQPPGGILQQLETPNQAVRHHFREVTGMTPRLGSLLLVEDHYIVDDEKQAWHLSVLYYALKRPEATVASLTEIESSSQPEWVPLATLKREQLQLGFEAIEAGRLRLQI